MKAQDRVARAVEARGGMMDIWEAKYEALAAGIQDEEYIKNAEALVDVALKVSSTQPVTFEQAFRALYQAVIKLTDAELGEAEAMETKQTYEMQAEFDKSVAEEILALARRIKELERELDDCREEQMGRDAEIAKAESDSFKRVPWAYAGEVIADAICKQETSYWHERLEEARAEERERIAQKVDKMWFYTNTNWPYVKDSIVEAIREAKGDDG